MKNKKVLGLVGLAALTAVGGTFAYFNQTATLYNPFNTREYSTTVIEDFKPEDGENWVPGVEVNKDLFVENTGDEAVVVRVKFEDIWERNDTEFHVVTGSNAITTVKSGNQEDATDGLVPKNEKTVVYKELIGSGTDWIMDEDGWFYYTEVLEAGAQTPKFLDYVKLHEDTDFGSFVTKRYYTTEEERPEIPDFTADTVTLDKWKEYTTDEMPDETTHVIAVSVAEPDKKGYSAADYTLKITVQTVQATDDAVEATFTGIKSDAVKNVVKNWNLKEEDNQSSN